MSRQTKFRSRIRFSAQHVEGGSDTDLEARVAAVLQDRPDTDLLRENIANAKKQSIGGDADNQASHLDGSIDALEQQIAVIKSDIEYRYWELACVQAEKLKLLHEQTSPGPQAAEDAAVDESDKPESQSTQPRSLSNRLRQLFNQELNGSGSKERVSTQSESSGSSHTRLGANSELDAAVETVQEQNSDAPQKQIIVRQRAEDPVAEAEWLASIGRYDDAIARLDRAKEISPARVAFIDALREVFILSREFDVSEQLSEASATEHGVEQALYEVDATPFELVQAYIELDDQDAALTMLNKILQQGSANEQITAREMLDNLAEAGRKQGA